MKILLQSIDTKRYLGRGGIWIDNPEAALAFLDGVRAKDYSIYRRLQNVQVVAWDVPAVVERYSAAPVDILADQVKLPSETFFIARENGEPIGKESDMKANRTRLTSEPLMAHQMAETVGEKAERRPREARRRGAGPPAAVEPMTVVEARVDVGLGNRVFIRGQGNGLSWDKGQALECIDGAKWIWSTRRATGRVVFKLLLNDQVWSKGEDLTVDSGGRIEVSPAF